MSKLVGMLGLGIMGGAISRNLTDRGWRVIGYDTDERRSSELAAQGLTIVGSAKDVAQKSEVIITSLPNASAALAIAAEIAQAGLPPRLVVETSTLAIADKIQFESVLASGGHIALDCPLSGTGAQAQVRDLIVYASGDSVRVLQCMPLFADFAKRSANLGEFGNGSRMKFIANHLVAIHNVAAAEAMSLAVRAGLDPRQVFEMVGPGAGGSRMFQMRAPMMLERTYRPPTMRVSTWKKDMAIIAEFADALDCPTPMFECTQAIYAEAEAMGFGEQDTAAVFEVMLKRAGANAG